MIIEANFRLIYENFFDGYNKSSSSGPMPPNEQAIWVKIKEDLTTNYNWSDTVKFVRLSSQNCSEMLIFTGLVENLNFFPISLTYPKVTHRFNS